MKKLSTLGLLSVTDGRLMTDIGDVYEVVSFFIGRPAYTHELPKYGRLIAPIASKEFPSLSAAPERPWELLRDKALAEFGPEIEVPDEWRNALADGKNAIETLIDTFDERQP